jgi:hypothetical protein
MSAPDDLPTRSLRRVPLWPFIVLAIALLAALFVWFRWRDEVLERRAIARLQALPGVRMEPKGSRILRGAFAGPNPWYIHLFGPTSAGVYSIHLTEPLPASARHDLAAIRYVYEFNARGSWFTDDFFAAVRCGDSLRRVRLIDTAVTDRAFDKLAGLPGLEYLQLTGSPIRGPALATFATLPNLHVLSLGRTGISDGSLAPLAGRRPLFELDLYDTPITDAAGPALASMPNLRKLSLDRTSIGDATLAALAKKSRVWTTLSLRHTRVTTAGLATAGIQAANFYLAGTGIDDSAAPWLASCDYVDRLDLSRTGITDAGLIQLRDMDELTYIRLQQTAVTDHGIIGLLHGDPAVTGPLDTPDGLAAAIKSIRARKQKPFAWVEPADLEGTGVSPALKSHLATGRFPKPARKRTR